MTSEKGIAFSSPMVLALLDDAKTQTRRLVKPEIKYEPDGARNAKWYIRRKSTWDSYETMEELVSRHAAYRAGDTLWLREGWRIPKEHDDFSPAAIEAREPELYDDKGLIPIRYEADGFIHPELEEPREWGRYRQARFMPKWASRPAPRLRVTGVRVEKLGEISESDARAEGAVHWVQATTPTWTATHQAAPGLPLKCFGWLWDSIHGENAIEKHLNKYVWVFTFEVIE